ncbi:unnamed protein product [Darwinula stevensoni]|uniref:C2H2-type domain-containing protein n=1 Tax=Darwinula stevensoni TaxID=69355 RepID=A0A7R8XA21_9CRUS|nr:unnamed protein product [Darwinula stevensoni]CAG0889778.1 unnamed protein product [Darwinula stevensoni]
MPLLEQQMSSTSKEHVQAGDGEDKDTGGIVIFKCSKSTCHQVFLSLKAAQCCGRRFTEYSSMKKHELTHKKEKTFKCDTCGQQYKYACSLRSHMKSAHCLHEAPSKKIKTVLSAAEDLIEQDDHAINKSVYSLRSNTKVVRQKCQTGLLQMKDGLVASGTKQILETETLTVNESNCSSRSNVKPGGHKIRTPRKKVIKSSHETSSSGQHIEKQISAVNDSTSFLVTSASHHLQATPKPTKSLDVPIPIDHIVDQVIHGLPEDITYTCEDGTQIFFLVDEEVVILR